jgi:hypothetical protein
MAQHVTFMRLKVRPGKLDELRGMMEGQEGTVAQAGWVASIIGQSKNDENEIMGAILWDTSENYYKNADRPEQNAQYEKMRALLASDPEWFDCSLLHEGRA